MTNEDRVKIYNKKKLYKNLTIIFSLITIILESFALFNMISFMWGIIPFILNILVKYLYDRVDIVNNKK